jgi:hypothetical protein
MDSNVAEWIKRFLIFRPRNSKGENNTDMIVKLYVKNKIAVI